jgi:hypothetical protein
MPAKERKESSSVIGCRLPLSLIAQVEKLAADQEIAPGTWIRNVVEERLIGGELAAIVAEHRTWSHRTFGPGKRTLGTIAHIRKELAEIEAKPDDLMEWIDVVMLAINGYWRHGGDSRKFAVMLKAKLEECKRREWPAPTSEDEPIEHVKVKPKAADAFREELGKALSEAVVGPPRKTWTWAEEWKKISAMESGEAMDRFSQLRNGRKLVKGFAQMSDVDKVKWLERNWPL